MLQQGVQVANVVEGSRLCWRKTKRGVIVGGLTRRIAIGAAIFVATFLLGGPAEASEGRALRPDPARVLRLEAPEAGSTPSLTSDERQTLLAGGLVERPLTLKRPTARYVGGVAYQLVRASPEEVLATLQSTESLPQALPRTKRARLVAAEGRHARVELVQGTSVAEATYTVHLVRDPLKDELRFWLDHARPHDIADVWGYFRVRRFDRERSLITVAVALDVGPGLVRLFFEDKIQRLILATPRHIKEFVEPRRFAQAR
jgi:hypothetical protein